MITFSEDQRAYLHAADRSRRLVPRLDEHLNQGPEAGGAAAAVMKSTSGSSWASWKIGVTVGLSVWVLTKILDPFLFRQRGKKK